MQLHFVCFLIIFTIIHPKIGGVNSFLMLNSHSDNGVFSMKQNTSDTNNEDLTRVYVYFSKLHIDPKANKLVGHFYTSDGRATTIEASQLVRAGLTDNDFDTRLFFFDINNYYQMADFSLVHLSGSQWGETGLTKISGGVYEYKTNNYSDIDSSSGWHPISISSVNFCDSILYNIDVNRESRCNGYLTYETLNQSFFTNLKDLDFEHNNYYWDDKFSGERTDFKTKWENLRKNYDSNKNNYSSFPNWTLFIGILIIVACLFLIVAPVFIQKNIYAKLFKRQ